MTLITLISILIKILHDVPLEEFLGQTGSQLKSAVKIFAIYYSSAYSVG